MGSALFPPAPCCCILYHASLTEDDFIIYLEDHLGASAYLKARKAYFLKIQPENKHKCEHMKIVALHTPPK